MVNVMMAGQREGQRREPRQEEAATKQHECCRTLVHHLETCRPPLCCLKQESITIIKIPEE